MAVCVASGVKRHGENPKNTNANNVKARKAFYDWLAAHIQIDGIVRIERDEAFDDKDYYRSGGIRLYNKSYATQVKGVKEGMPGGRSGSDPA
jgi:hypothetical protein